MSTCPCHPSLNVPDHFAQHTFAQRRLSMPLMLLIIIGAALAVAPWAPGVTMPTGTKVFATAIGTALLIIGVVCLLITRLYRKASANMAFVRTGMGGVRVIRDGGTLVIPVIHQVIPVSLETMRLNVERRGPHALIT